MSMHQKNDRSVHTDAKRIKANLARHAALMDAYIAKGMSRDDASKLAAVDMGVYKRVALR